jgi:hypothetical protein
MPVAKFESNVFVDAMVQRRQGGPIYFTASGFLSPSK